MPVISPGNGSSQPRSKSVRSRSQAAQMSSALVLDLRRGPLASRTCARRARRDRSGSGSSPCAELAQERAVDDEVGVAADRRGEVRVRGAREAGVAEVARVVVRLLQRAQDERGKRLLPRPALRTYSVTRSLASAARRAASDGRHALALRDGRRRHLEVGRASRAGARRPAARAARGRGRATRACGSTRNSATASLARIISSSISACALRLGLEPGALDAALAVEREVDLAALDAERAAGEAAPAQLGRDAVGQPERRRPARAGSLALEDPLRLAVREAARGCG